MSKHIRADTRIQNLEFAEPWKNLTEKEANYAYYFSKASWAGTKMLMH